MAAKVTYYIKPRDYLELAYYTAHIPIVGVTIMPYSDASTKPISALVGFVFDKMR